MSSPIMFNVCYFGFTNMIISLYICIMCNWISLGWLLLIILSIWLVYRIFLLKIVTLFIINICLSQFWRSSYFGYSISFIISITSYTCSSRISFTIIFYYCCTFFKRTIFFVLKILFILLWKISLRKWMSDCIVLLVIMLSCILSCNTLFLWKWILEVIL